MENYSYTGKRQPIYAYLQYPPIKSRRDSIWWQIILFVICTIFIIAIYLRITQQNDNTVVPLIHAYDTNNQIKLICYYTAATSNGGGGGDDNLRLLDIPGDLCTHINIGIADVSNLTTLTKRLHHVLSTEAPTFRATHPQVKLLLWIGGADSGVAFKAMIANHEHRKRFLQSLRSILQTYTCLDGIDLDWEFPTAYNKERQHLSQLLYEIRAEWRREHRDNRILSLAVAAPEGIASYAYDMRELNLYVDHVNLMAYDFHFYAKRTPFTGLNAPLNPRPNEHSIMATFNINYTVHWWLQNGIEPHRLVVGLPTYGHSFKLVNPFNRRIGAPAMDYGECGLLGFTTQSQTCKCAGNYLQPIYVYDNATCSPYLSANLEWISYENIKSISCKANFIKTLNIGGAMIFSLNADDLTNVCRYLPQSVDNKTVFPLTQTVRDCIKST